MTQITFPIAQMWGILLSQHPDLPRAYKTPELAFSYPLLIGRGVGLKIAWLVYPFSLIDQSAVIGRPLAIVEAEWNQATLSAITVRQDPGEFSTLHASFPLVHPRLQTRPPISKQEIYASYTPLMDLFPDKPSGPVGKKLAYLLEQIIEPELQAFYRAAAPSFFNWLSS